MPEDWEKRAKDTLKKAGHRGGEAVSHKVPRIREENKERGAYPLGRPKTKLRHPITTPKDLKTDDMTLEEAGHRGGEAVSHKLHRPGGEKQD